MIDYIPRGFSTRKGYLYARGSGISPFGELISQVRKTATIQVEKRSFEYASTLKNDLAKLVVVTANWVKVIP